MLSNSLPKFSVLAFDSCGTREVCESYLLLRCGSRWTRSTGDVVVMFNHSTKSERSQESSNESIRRYPCAFIMQCLDNKTLSVNCYACARHLQRPASALCTSGVIHEEKFDFLHPSFSDSERVYSPGRFSGARPSLRWNAVRLNQSFNRCANERS